MKSLSTLRYVLIEALKTYHSFMFDSVVTDGYYYLVYIFIKIAFQPRKYIEDDILRLLDFLLFIQNADSDSLVPMFPV